MKKFIMRLCTTAMIFGLGIFHFNKVNQELYIFDKSKELLWSRTAIAGFYIFALIFAAVFSYWIWTEKEVKNIERKKEAEE